jgi:hypothetical protein
MVDDVNVSEVKFGARGVDSEGGASGFDVCKLATVDHAQICLLIL